MSMIDDIAAGLFDQDDLPDEDDLPDISLARPSDEALSAARVMGEIGRAVERGREAEWRDDRSRQVSAGERALVRERDQARIRMNEAEARLLDAQVGRQIANRQFAVDLVDLEESNRNRMAAREAAERDLAAWQEQVRRHREDDDHARLAARQARAIENPANWTPEQRRIAGMDMVPTTVSPIDESNRIWDEAAARIADADQASAMLPGGNRPVAEDDWVPPGGLVGPARRASHVEAERANRFRNAAELENAMQVSRRAAEMLLEAEALLGRAKELAKGLGDEAKFREAQELDDKLQAIEDSIEGIGG